jgi:hypothetical protein
MDSANYLRSVRTSSIWVTFVLCMHSISTSFVNNYYTYPIKYLNNIYFTILTTISVSTFQKPQSAMNFRFPARQLVATGGTK